MKIIILLLIGAISVSSKSEKCEVTTEDCENMTSEYEKYRDCMERRTKRSAECYEEKSDCDDCDCNECNYKSCSSCSNNNCCSRCCQQNSCSSYSCCHQTCRAECKSSACRSSCKRKCQDSPSPIVDGPDSSVISQIKTNNQHNITTVIHLNNMINNTNLINLPISVNNTVLNNITNEGHYTSGSGQDKCCLTIGPRQCIQQSSFPFVRCFHIRKKACGSMCTSPIVHYQTHEICDNEVSAQQPCQQQTVYIPQPQPRCAYQSTWPYVTCGNQQLQSCEGCYSQYVKRDEVTKCSNFCYDDGYGVGPYYRQGPFYRPGYAAAPSCEQTGSCGGYGYGYGYGNGYGYDGFEGVLESGFPVGYPAIDINGNVADTLNLKSLDPNGDVIGNKISDHLLKIDTNVQSEEGGRYAGRYAEIRIQPINKTEVDTSADTPAL